VAISAVKIANLALSNLGARSSIESFTEETAEANEADLWYNFSREAVLAAYDWSFARKRLTLASHSEDPPDGVWAYRYQYPADCLVARYLVNPAGSGADAVPFEIEADSTGETKTILTDLDDAVLVYTWKLEITDLFSPHFVLCLSFLLAHHMALALTGKKAIRDDMLNRFLLLLLQADAQNANEMVDKPPREAESIRARD
jgi:hypothetical protein|tara:strand:- start:5048 stop:5650 length:603 start_codon:yes stop_codon:yes gene_type:complete